MNKIILSRKGFDSVAGGKPSPIFTDGSIFSIPIPLNLEHKKATILEHDKLTVLGNVHKGQYSGVDALLQVNSKLNPATTYCHHDPLLDNDVGLFGQIGKVQTELSKNDVTSGDLFLFFGWFRNYSIPTKPDIHHIFGWLEIDEIIHGTPAIREYCASRGVSHVHAHIDYPNNTLYVGRKNLSFEQSPASSSGFGEFKKTQPELCLTETGKTRSNWMMPKAYFSEEKNPKLFSNRLEWSGQNDNRIQCRGYGQEFIIDVKKTHQQLTGLGQ